MIRYFVAGAAIAVAASFPLAALVALVFRFPIPFGGYIGGLDAVMPAVIAVAFYGSLGGFFVQGVLGGIAGLLAARRAPPDRGHPWLRCVAASAIASLAGVLTMSILDWIIGPW